MNDDVRLLREYDATRSDAAFAEVVRRYIDFVYSSARRQVGDANLAEDVTQAVFIVLAKRAGSLPADRPISTWLLKTTSYCAANARRARGRRNTHERKAAEMAPKFTDDQQWESLSPLLDEGLSSLRGADRDALLMKFFEKKTLQQVGEALGVSEDAAQKRVTRAVEKLRDFFRTRGATTLSASGLSVLLAAEAAKNAPIGLATSVSASAAAGAAATGTGAALAKGALIFMATEKIKIAAIAAVVILLSVGGAIVITSHRSSKPAVQAVGRSVGNWPVKFHDGTSVDVIAVNDPRNPDRWWALDGSPVDNPDFRAKGVINLNFSTARALHLIVRMRGSALGEKGLAIRTDVPLRTASLLAGSATERLIKFIIPTPSNASSGDVRIGLAGGPWDGEMSLPCANGELPPVGSTGGGVSFLGINEENGQTVVRVTVGRITELADDREVVIVAGGRELHSVRATSTGNVYTYTFDCPRSAATSVIARSRPHEWIELKNVAFEPTTTATRVEVAPVRSATTRPAQL